MRFQRLLLLNRVAVVMAALVCAVPAFGQADFFEDFEGLTSAQSGDHGPPQLIAAGWIFRNQSDPEGSGDWHEYWGGYQGESALGIDVSVSWWDGGNAEASSWAILLLQHAAPAPGPICTSGNPLLAIRGIRYGIQLR